MRFLVHFCAIISVIAVTSEIFLLDGNFLRNSGAVAMCTYVGIICMFPRGMGDALWIVPTALGVTQCLLLTLLGMTWQMTFLWGGILTWTLRFLYKKGVMGWELTVIPWMALALYAFFDDLAPLTTTTPLWTFLVLLFAGWAGTRLYTRINHDSLHRKMLKTACTRLDRAASSGIIPVPLREPVQHLASQGRAFEQALPHVDESSVLLICSVDSLASKLIGYSASSKKWSDISDKLFSEIAGLNEKIADRLAELQTPSSTADKETSERIREFQQQIKALIEKKTSLPLAMGTSIAGIAKAAEAILICMTTDPLDVAPADKFLSRYLTGTHTVVDEHLRLARQGGEHASVAQVLAKSAGLLEQLEKAFVDEHARLLRNDTVNFTAELNVLDKLLKMEGR